MAKMPDTGPYLDLCAGTLDLSLALLKEKNTKGYITAIDFCHAMLIEGKKKINYMKGKISGLERINIIAGDGEILPLKGSIYNAAMTGFGLRNLTDRRAGLKEIIRVLKPGGRLVILEFSQPVIPIFRKLYNIYFCHFLPHIGNIMTRGDRAYDHLRDSVLGFPNQTQLVSIMKESGFINVGYLNLTIGVVSIHWGDKPL